MIEMWEGFAARDAAAKSDGKSSAVSTQRELEYFVKGTDSDTDVFLHVAANAPAYARDPFSTKLLPRESIALKQLGEDLWKATIRFAREEDQPPPPRETGDIVIEWDTDGGTQHITQSKKTVQIKGTAGPLDTDLFKNAINVKTDAQGKVEPAGTDVLVGGLNFKITKYQPAGLVDDAYVRRVAKLRGKMNAGGFHGFEAGELLFRGGTGRQRNRGDWECTYEFSFSENLSSVPVGNGIVLSGKRGWDYLWVRYEEAEETGEKIMISKPTHGCVEQVYESGDFNDLQI